MDYSISFSIAQTPTVRPRAHLVLGWLASEIAGQQVKSQAGRSVYVLG